MVSPIAVAVASFNHAPFVEECLTSIVHQSVDDLELCWVDDSSTDGSFVKVQELLNRKDLRNRFRRVFLRRNNVNRGAAYSLNLAARMSDAPLIAFMNSDDSFHPSRLKKLVPSLPSDPLYFAFSNVLPVDSDGSSMVADPLGQKIAFDASKLVERFASVEAAFLHRQIASTTGNFVVSRKLFDNIGGFKDLKYCHDWMFALQACLRVRPYFNSERLYFYRLHTTNSFRSLGHLAEKETIDVLRSYYVYLSKYEPNNVNIASPQKQPTRFWETAAMTSTVHIAERVFFPYSKGSRLLSSPR